MASPCNSPAFGLGDLPNEILLVIFSSDNLYQRDHYALVLTSRRITTLAKTVLYAHFDSGNEISSYHSTGKDWDRSVSFVTNMMRYPEHRGLVKHLTLGGTGWLLAHYQYPNMETPYAPELFQLAFRQLEQSEIDRMRPLPDYAMVTPLPLIAPHPRRTRVAPVRSCRKIPKAVKYRALKLDPSLFFSNLRHLTIHPSSPELPLYSIWLKAPALEKFEIRGIDGWYAWSMMHWDEIPDAKAWYSTVFGEVKSPGLSLRELVLEECIAPMHNFSIIMASCQSLVDVRASWTGSDDQNLESSKQPCLRFAQLIPGLSQHGKTLQRISLDVSKAICYSDDGIGGVSLAAALGAPPPGLRVFDSWPDYRGIGSLKKFPALQHLEISTCMLGPFVSVEELIEKLPESLESLVLLSPTQYGQPSIDELVEGMLGPGSSRLANLKVVNGRKMG